MTCLGLRICPGAVALAAAIACFATPLLAQSADAGPTDSGAAVADGRPAAPPSNDVPVVPFAVVHPTYVPSQPAPDDQIAPEGDSRPQPARRAPARVKTTAVPAAPPDVSQDASPAATEPPTPAETLLAVSAPVTPAAPAAIDRPRPATAPAAVTLTRYDLLRLLTAAACVAIFFAGIGFALGRRIGRRRNMPAVVAKTPSWLAVMPTDLAEPAEDLAPEPEEPVARSPDKRVKRGRPLDRAGPAAPKGDATAEAKRGVAAGQRVFQL